jgi:hypothetical protein
VSLSNVLGTKFVSELDVVKNNTDKLNEILSLIPTDTEVGVTFDPTEAIKGIASLVGSVETAIEIMKAFNFEIEYEPIRYVNENGAVLSLDEYVKLEKKAKDNPDKYSDFSSKDWMKVGGSIGVRNEPSTPDFDYPDNTTDKEEEKWTNPYDKLYNLTQKINEVLRERDRIEKRYDLMIRKRDASYEKVAEYEKAQLKNLETQRAQ